MRVPLAENEAELIESARRPGRSAAAPRAAQHDRDATFPIENFRDMHGEESPSPFACCGRGQRGAARTYCLAAAELGRYRGATALSWNMHVLDAVDRSADRRARSHQRGRAEHNRRRSLHYRRIVDQGTIYSQPFSKAARRPPAWSPSAPRQDRWTAAFWSPARRSSPRSRVPPTLGCCAPSAARTRRRRAATPSTRPCRRAPRHLVVGDWDPLGMRGTVSRTLLLENAFVAETRC